jgi:two-component system, sensor histidine kinase
MSGSINVTSEIGKGTNFIFKIKLKNRSEEKANSNFVESINKNIAKDIKILIAEDNSINQILIKTILSQNNYRFILCEDGEKAFQHYKNEKFDLILMDLMMPIMDGYEATQRIREYEKNNQLKETPILALSADVTSSELNSLKDKGFNHYLPKPFEKSDLLKIISILIK